MSNVVSIKRPPKDPDRGRCDGDKSETILIPKKLRMEWTDVMALDNSLSHSAFRAGCIIGSHFNGRSGETYVKQSTIAGEMGCCERTVWTAIKELETKGYLIIERRDLGVRASDGRRVCGGKGVANVYRPAFQREQIVATASGAKLAARCDLYQKQRSQNSSTKVAASCDPTLNPPSEGTQSWDFSRLPKVSHELATRVADELRSRLSNDVFASWFGRLQVSAIEGDTVQLLSPSEFVRKRVNQNYGDDLLAAWQAVRPQTMEVTINVVSSSQ